MPKNPAKKQYFPHNSRFITEALFSSTTLLPMGIILITLLNIRFQPDMQGRFNQIKQNVLVNPLSITSHTNLVKWLKNSNNTYEQEKSLISWLAIQSSQHSSVLGETISDHERHEPKSRQKQISFWESELEEKPDYKDAHLQLAFLYLQENNLEKAKKHLDLASRLDPNAESIVELTKLLNYSQ